MCDSRIQDQEEQMNKNCGNDKDNLKENLENKCERELDELVGDMER
jgi:hypothetical protein